MREDYINPNRKTQAGKLIIVGAPGTGKTYCEFFAVLYMYAGSLFGIPTSYQGETASAAGGVHDSKFYHTPIHANRNAQNDLEFSLWYNRKVNYKPFFGLFGEKQKMQIIDKWGFQKTDAIDYLKIFLDKEYQELEALMSI